MKSLIEDAEKTVAGSAGDQLSWMLVCLERQGKHHYVQMYNNYLIPTVQSTSEYSRGLKIGDHATDLWFSLIVLVVVMKKVQWW